MTLVYDWVDTPSGDRKVPFRECNGCGGGLRYAEEWEVDSPDWCSDCEAKLCVRCREDIPGNGHMLCDACLDREEAMAS